MKDQLKFNVLKIIFTSLIKKIIVNELDMFISHLGVLL